MINAFQAKGALFSSPFQCTSLKNCRAEALKLLQPLNQNPQKRLFQSPASLRPLPGRQIKKSLKIYAHMSVTSSSLGQSPSWNHQDSLTTGAKPCWPIFKNVSSHAPHVARPLPAGRFCLQPFLITFIFITHLPPQINSLNLITLNSP